jgi:hypothetical protein
MSDDKMTGCVGSVVLLVAAIAAVPFQGWALWLMWNWFAVAVAPAITWHAAVGLSLLIGFLKMREGKPDERPLLTKLNVFAMNQVAVLVTVGFGWVFHAVGFGATR